MKKVMIMFFAVALLLVGCKKDTTVTLPPEEIFEKMMEIDGVPAMLSVPADKGYMLFGIDPNDCNVEITAICNDSLRADEIWIIEAKDSAATARVLRLAKERLEQKSTELKDYLPDQYEIVKRGTIIENENLVIMIISPYVDSLVKVIG